MKQNPFSIYDFLGYLIPGAVLLYSIHFILRYENFLEFLNMNTVSFELLGYIPFVLLAYLLGHILAICASIFIESFSYYINGYPSSYLFSNQNKKYLSSPTKCGNIGRVVLYVVIFPIASLNTIGSNINLLRQAKELASPLKETVFLQCCKVLREKFNISTDSWSMDDGIKGDYLRLLYHYSFEFSERHSNKLQNYVSLYGFSRNISFVFIVLFWISFIYIDFSNIATVFIPLIFGIISYIFYVGFVKFYRRYSLEVLMATCVVTK